MTETIRAIRPADAPQMAAMIAEISRHEGVPPPRCTAQDLTEAAFGAAPIFDGFIAEASGLAVGLVLSHRGFDTQQGGPTRQIMDLYVALDMRRRGLGRRLIARVARQAAAEGAVFVQWSAHPANSSAISFYGAIGAERDVFPRFELDVSGIRRLATDADR